MTTIVTEPVVRGRVQSSTSASVGGLTVLVVDRNVGGDTVIARASTDGEGGYRATYSREQLGAAGRKERADLQVQVLVGDRVVARSDVRYGAQDDEVVDVLLPAGVALASEHAALLEAIGRVHDGAVGDLQEQPDHGDVTYVANKTGWDARAVAMAVAADRLAAPVATDPRLDRLDAVPAELYYALLRAGVPADPTVVHSIDPETVVGVWKDALETGVVPALPAETLKSATTAYLRTAAATALQRSTRPGASTLGELLTISLGENRDAQQTVARLAVERTGEEFWAGVTAELGQQTTDRMKLDGKLAFLSLDNATVVQRLHQATDVELTDPVQLARHGFADPEKWTGVLDGVELPESVDGDTPEARRTSFAVAASAQLRQSYPTATVTAMVESGAAVLPAGDDVRQRVVGFLDTHLSEFDVAREPVRRYVQRKQLGDTVGTAELDQISALQRVYQITPDDTALRGLLAGGVHSAFQVVGQDRRAFVAGWADRLGGTATAELVYRKAAQVHTTVTHLALGYALARSAPALGSGTGSMLLDVAPTGGEAALDGGVLPYPTLESLFGSLDYCGCDDCRSFLSPAAYLVDLLMFVDADVAGSLNPQDVLLRKRPDLADLPLTCENTNTPLPYIDIVNEVLEYFVVNNPRRVQPETAPTMTGFTGHDTDDRVTAAELAAEPRFVDDDAYTALLAENYPPPLPFHRPLETIRRHLGALSAPLPDVMTALRAGDAVERPTPDSYGWRDILAEQLGLSRQQYRLLTDSTVGLADLYGYPAATTDDAVVADLTNFVAFARRSQLQYTEVVDLLTTRFVNPDAVLIPRLERLGVGIATIKQLKDGAISDADFTALLRPGLDPAEYGGDVLAWLRDDAVYARITGLLTVNVPAGADQCDVETLELRYALPDTANNRLRPVDLVRLARFVRLWRALGWSIADVDHALCAVWPSELWPVGNGADALTRLDTGMLAALPRLGYVRRLVDRLRLKVPRDLASLVTLWTPIDTHGPGSLFARLFQTGSGLQQDPAFADDGYGGVLTAAGVDLLDHAEAVRGASSLTGAEFTTVVTALGYDATTPLGVEQVSAVYRRGWLARVMRISVAELLALVEVTGIDPFTAPDPPAAGALALLDLVDLLRAAGLKPSEALRLVWNRNLTGARGVDDAALATTLHTLRAALAAVDADFTVAEDPQGELSRARLGAVYDADTVDRFFGLVEGTSPFTARYLAPDDGVPAAVLAAGNGALRYDDLGRQLVHDGPMSTTVRDAILAVAGLPADLATAIGALFTAGADALTAFFAAHPELEAAYTAFVGSAAPLPERRTALLAAVLPELVRRRKEQQVLVTTTAALGVDATFGPALLGDAAVLHAATDTTRPALDDLLAAVENGVTAEFFLRATATGVVDVGPVTVPAVDHTAGAAVPLPTAPGNGPVSGRWTGRLEVPQAGTWALEIDTDAGAAVRLSLGGAAVTLVAAAGRWRNQDPIVLPAGVPTPFELVVENVTSTVVLQWATVGLATQTVPGRYLYPAGPGAAAADHLRRSLVAVTLADHAHLTAAETAHLGATSQLGGTGWLNSVPVAVPALAPASTALVAPLTEWCEFAVAKAQFSPDDDRVLSVIADPDATLDDGSPLLVAVTGWEDASTAALLTRFGLTRADLARPAVFGRVRRAMDVVRAVGVDAATLLGATTNDPTGDTVRTLRAALRARTDADSWLEVLKPINDTLRERQRDALVAFTLARLAEDPGTAHIDTLDKLFEYFLMDVGMQSTTSTSRIRHALSSVQLFVDRCLLNLEPGISPAAISSSRWAWMKRYRVWEANRKVFLWPENWLEPELRDDSSPIFTDVVGELLQSDITDDAAAAAFGRYLTGLEEVAKLEPSGIFVSENSPGVQDDVVHVVAHTPGAHRKYFHRVRRSGSWSAWRHMKLDIEGDPVVPCVWQGRLFAFWIRVTAQPQTAPTVPGSGTTPLTSLTHDDVAAVAPQVTMQAILCYSEYVNGAWQPAKSSDPTKPVTLRVCQAHQFDRSGLTLSTYDAPEGGLTVEITGNSVYQASFRLYNTHSAPVRTADVPPSTGFVLLTPFVSSRSLSTASKELVATYEPANFFLTSESTLTRDVLTTHYLDRVVEPNQTLNRPWDAPFLYSDSQHAFYVTTTQSQVAIGVFDGYATVRTAPGNLAKAIPSVVVTVPAYRKPDPIGPIAGGDPYRTDRADVQQLITEDAYIHTGIGNIQPVVLDGRIFGPNGALGTVSAQR